MINTREPTRDGDRAELIRRLHEAARVERARTVRALFRKLIRRPWKAPPWCGDAFQPAVHSGR